MVKQPISGRKGEMKLETRKKKNPFRDSTSCTRAVHCGANWFPTRTLMRVSAQACPADTWTATPGPRTPSASTSVKTEANPVRTLLRQDIAHGTSTSSLCVLHFEPLLKHT